MRVMAFVRGSKAGEMVGTYHSMRIKNGEEFDIDERELKLGNARNGLGVPIVEVDKAGNPVRPTKPMTASWFRLVTPESRADFADSQRSDASRAREAALAAAGPKKSKRGFAVAEGAEESVERFAPAKGRDEDLV